MAKLIHSNLLVAEKSILLSPHKKQRVEKTPPKAGTAQVSIENLLSEQKIKLELAFSKRLAESELKVFDAGMKKGLDEGKKEALNTLDNKRNVLLCSLESIVKSLSETQNEVTEYVKTLENSCQQELLEIIFDSVLKIIGDDFALKSDSVNSIVFPLLMQFSNNRRVQIKLSKVDYDFMNSEINKDVLSSLPNNFFIEKQDGMEKSGLMLCSDEGELDLRLSTKLEQFKTLLIQNGNFS